MQCRQGGARDGGRADADAAGVEAENMGRAGADPGIVAMAEAIERVWGVLETR